jgi:hypothetical protein
MHKLVTHYVVDMCVGKQQARELQVVLGDKRLQCPLFFGGEAPRVDYRGSALVIPNQECVFEKRIESEFVNVQHGDCRQTREWL